MIKFAHPQLGQDVKGRAGYYVAVEEHSFLHEGREVLYILGYACVDNSCCGALRSWGYVQVPGFLLRRHIGRDESGRPVSEVETIEDERDRHGIRQSLLERYPGIQIDMWDARCGEELPSRSTSGAASSAVQSGGIA